MGPVQNLPVQRQKLGERPGERRAPTKAVAALPQPGQALEGGHTLTALRLGLAERRELCGTRDCSPLTLVSLEVRAPSPRAGHLPSQGLRFHVSQVGVEGGSG